MKVITTIQNEGFSCQIHLLDNGHIEFIADADIDADGANGQHGQKAAYRVDNRGSENLSNGGMGVRNGQVVFTKTWGPDIAEINDEGNPLVIDGVIITRTAYTFREQSDKRFRWVDAETVPYIVVPKVIINAVIPTVLGCHARVEYNNRLVETLVADVGPRNKIGELSIAAARAVGIDPSPRTGGLSLPRVRYTIMPGVPAHVNGVDYNLQRSK